MTSTRCEIFNWVLIPLTVVVYLFSFGVNENINKYLTPEAEVNALYFLSFLITISHIHYGICMVRN